MHEPRIMHQNAVMKSLYWESEKEEMTAELGSVPMSTGNSNFYTFPPHVYTMSATGSQSSVKYTVSVMGS